MRKDVEVKEEVLHYKTDSPDGPLRYEGKSNQRTRCSREEEYGSGSLATRTYQSSIRHGERKVTTLLLTKQEAEKKVTQKPSDIRKASRGDRASLPKQLANLAMHSQDDICESSSGEGSGCMSAERTCRCDPHRASRIV